MGLRTISFFFLPRTIILYTCLPQRVVGSELEKSLSYFFLNNAVVSLTKSLKKNSMTAKRFFFSKLLRC